MKLELVENARIIWLKGETDAKMFSVSSILKDSIGYKENLEIWRGT